jgi:hypothetical protein
MAASMALRLGTSAAVVDGATAMKSAMKTTSAILGENKRGPNFSLARYNGMNFKQEKSIGRRDSGNRWNDERNQSVVES